MPPTETRGKVKKLLRRNFLQMAAGGATLAVTGRAARTQAYPVGSSKVTVRFATNRNWIAGDNFFGSDFRTASDGLFATGTIDVNNQGGIWDWDPKSLKIDPAPKVSSSSIPQAIAESSSAPADTIAEFIAPLTELKTKIVFLPGFNYTFKDAMTSSAQICSAYEIGEIFCFSWPSQGQFGLNPYLTDEKNAYRSGAAIALALSVIFSRVRNFALGDRPQLHIVCHSMGNRALSAAIQEITLAAPELLSENYFDYALLMAADEDNNAFEEPDKLKKFLTLATNIDVYTNDSDAAMVLSSFVNRRAPMGSFGPVNFADLPRKVIWIDCTDVGNTGSSDWGHQYFRNSPRVAADVHQVLEGIPANQITPRNADFSYPERKFVIPFDPESPWAKARGYK
jgi:esterase/lipase superfamily enzyme